MDKSTVIQGWIDQANNNRGTGDFEISYSAFKQILNGTTPTISDIADQLNRSESDIVSRVQYLVDQGRLTLGASQEITGAGGLSAVQSRHSIEIEGKQFWGWCALDVVGIPAGLRASAWVTSNCEDTGEAVAIEFLGGRCVNADPQTVAIALAPLTLSRSVHDTVCNQISFLRTDNPDRGSGRVVLSLDEAIDLGTKLWTSGIPL